MRGPLGKILYYGDGYFHLCNKEEEKPRTLKLRHFSKIGMLCGGTGITPIYQILQAAHQNNDTAEFTLLYSNKTKSDIIFKDELEKFFNQQKFKFKLYHTLTQENKNWEGLTGRIDENKIRKLLPPPSSETLILTSGRGKMCKKFLIPLLIDMGYAKENVFKF
jgi:NAD(P)H-flavin reductase